MGAAAWMARWWPLAALIAIAAALRLSTLDLQSFWYDEAFTPVHVLRPSLWATLRDIAHTENTPPLWYLLAWGDSRVLGSGEVALRLPSALAGIATVPVAWMIGRELAGRRAAVLAAALVAVNPLFVWYSQEARAYALFVLMAALAMLCFLRIGKEPASQSSGRGGRGSAGTLAFAVSGSLALLTHYFAVFLLIPMALLLLRDPRRRRAALPAIAVIAVVGLALLALVSAQGGHGTQWIGRWPLSDRLQAILQYYLTGPSGAPLGHGVELLIALPILAGVGLGLSRMLERERRGAMIALLIAACGVLIPIALVAFGADYLAPRNLVAAMIPVSILIAVLLASPSNGLPGVALATANALAFLAISLDVDGSPRLQRGDWRGLADVLRGVPGDRVITTVELGAAPLEYYLPGLHNLPRGAAVSVTEIDETGYSPLRAGAGLPPAPGFRLLERRSVHGLVVYRFVSAIPRLVRESTLRRHVITLAHPEVLVGTGLRASSTRAQAPARLAQMSSSDEKI
jgi:4-amino-4-deoxy-L-arabinose transferase-like glycosyltransferase